jgi:hypothetical protein
MNKVCVECDALFDPHSREKRRAGGLSHHCPDCSSDDTVRYLGVAAGEGKAANVSILKFNTKEDRKAYKDFWYATSGMNVGKSCQLTFRAKEPSISFETKAVFVANPNHKGKT